MAQQRLPAQCGSTLVSKRWCCLHGQHRTSALKCRAVQTDKSSSAAWQQQLADATGIRYKPTKQQPQEVDDALFEAQDELSVEDIFVEDWTAEDDEEGIIEDTEVYNMDTGWSLTDLDLDDSALPHGNNEEWSSGEEDPTQQGLAVHSILNSIPAHLLKALETQQSLANTINAETQANKKSKKKANGKAALGSMRIVTGSAAGKRLLSPPGDTTRPMMEKVRGAVFSMLGSLGGTQPMMPAGTRWLDLFAGTGAVGLEALSRGCQESHFVEMDATVARDCLQKNIAACGLSSQSSVHIMKAEVYLQQARNGLQYAGAQPFDYISVCPPYEKASYEQLYELLDGSPLVNEDTVIVVEYARKVQDVVKKTIGPLGKVRDKRYGRTFVAVYASPRAEDD